ncbi:unnamed protein product [Dibothriocephalus latus]|uniref:Arp2/3 complex 34 kDa subunit n=1 Tax=Dibothriocephalus latus TaxID=60516 RepID=A0A3P7P017_DIBLA|nr:unnamed protein product [Dibothriocephalus latus]
MRIQLEYLISLLILHRFRAYFPKNVEVTISDFDGVLYNISQKTNSTILTVSITLRFFKEIEKFGASKVLSREYGSFLASRPEGSASVTLQIDCEKLPDNVEELATKVAMLRRHCFASVFEHFFDYQMSKPTQTLQGIIHFRTDETMYAQFEETEALVSKNYAMNSIQILYTKGLRALCLHGNWLFNLRFVQAMSDRVTVIFSTRFKDPGDIVLGKTFLQVITLNFAIKEKLA